MASTLGAALYYAQEKGWPVLPVWPVDMVDTGNGRVARCRCGSASCEKSIGKHPIAKVNGISVAPRGVLDATTNSRLINKWWKLVPDANIGIRGDKFFALDVDDESGYFDLIESNGHLPDTVESLSGSGGRHILFKQPGNRVLGNEEGKLPNGINVRGGSGYIIAPPSMHKSGQRYAWELSSHPRDVEVAEAPDWLINLIGDPKETKIEEIESLVAPDDLKDIRVHPKIKKSILEGPEPGEDRSELDQKVITALLSAGLEPGEVKGIFNRYPIGTQGKYAERGDRYLDRSIARGVMYIDQPDQAEPSSKKDEATSVIIPGKKITRREAKLERVALDSAYLQGWSDALRENTDLVNKLWPDRVGVTESSILHYNLGIRKDFKVDETDREFAALVVPYKHMGEIANVGYELYNQPDGIPGSLWESQENSHVFDPDIDGSKNTGRVLVTEDWDTAMTTYLRYGHIFQGLSILGLPKPPAGSSGDDLASYIAGLASMLTDSEQVLLAWPASRHREGLLLASMLERGDSRVLRLTLPGTMRQMYQKFGMEAKHLNRYMRQAEPIG